MTPAQRHDLARLFVQEFFTLAVYTQNAICRALGIEQLETRSSPTKEIPQSSKTHSFSSTPGDVGDLQRAFPIDELDLLLPKVCEALVLVSQCLTSLTLHSEEDRKGKEVESQPISAITYVASAHSAADIGFVESLLGKSHYHFPSSAKSRRILIFPYATFREFPKRVCSSLSTRNATLGRPIPSKNHAGQTYSFTSREHRWEYTSSAGREYSKSYRRS